MRLAWRMIDESAVPSASSSIGGSAGRALTGPPAVLPSEPNAFAEGLVGESTADAALPLGGEVRKYERMGEVEACGESGGGAAVRTRGEVLPGSTGVRRGGL